MQEFRFTLTCQLTPRMSSILKMTDLSKQMCLVRFFQNILSTFMAVTAVEIEVVVPEPTREEKKKFLLENGWYHLWNDDNWLQHRIKYENPDWAGINTDEAYRVAIENGDPVDREENVLKCSRDILKDCDPDDCCMGEK